VKTAKVGVRAVEFTSKEKIIRAHLLEQIDGVVVEVAAECEACSTSHEEESINPFQLRDFLKKDTRRQTNRTCEFEIEGQEVRSGDGLLHVGQHCGKVGLGHLHDLLATARL
jgi:hypothetical protein